MPVMVCMGLIRSDTDRPTVPLVREEPGRSLRNPSIKSLVIASRDQTTVRRLQFCT